MSFFLFHVFFSHFHTFFFLIASSSSSGQHAFIGYRPPPSAQTGRLQSQRERWAFECSDEATAAVALVTPPIAEGATAVTMTLEERTYAAALAAVTATAVVTP